MNSRESAGLAQASASIRSISLPSVTCRYALQLREIMYKHAASSIGGHLRIGDNAIVEVLSDGSRVERFRPIPAISTPDAMERLCSAYRAGYLVGKYVSIERAIEDSKDSCYDALKASSSGWIEGAGDYVPFVRYMLGVVLGLAEILNRALSMSKQAGHPSPIAWQRCSIEGWARSPRPIS